MIPKKAVNYPAKQLRATPVDKWKIVWQERESTILEKGNISSYLPNKSGLYHIREFSEVMKKVSSYTVRREDIIWNSVSKLVI
jgi:hypothetical protein